MKYKSSAIVAFAFLLLSIVSYFLPSLKVESGENRTLATFHMVLHPEPDSVVYRESPVERLEMALSDQYPFREAAVAQYLSLFNSLENTTYEAAIRFQKREEGQYILHSVGNYELIEDTGYITVRPSNSPLDEEVVMQRVAQLEHLHELYPEMKQYVYYVTMAFDMPWFNNCIGITAADHYQEITEAVPAYVRTGHLVYRDLDDYMNLHYKTDHHWNHRGAKRGYEDIYAMMSSDFDLGEMRIPDAEDTVSETYGFDYLGSYGRNLIDIYNEGYDTFAFYDFSLPQRKTAVIDPVTLEETEVVEIGLYDEYENGEIDKSIGADHYCILYGTAKDSEDHYYDDDAYLYVIRNSEGNGMNLLITGDSYDRAMRDVLASHFDTTVYMDYRILSQVPIDEIIEEYQIDVLLMSSHISMWDSEEYLFSFRGDE